MNTLKDFPFYVRAGCSMLASKFTNQPSSPNTGSSHLTQEVIGKVVQILDRNIKDNFCVDHHNRYFRPGLGHFQDFYIRDFGWVVNHLLKLGYHEEVRETLDFCMSAYKKNGRVTTCVTRNKKTYDFSRYAIDSLAFLVYSLKISGYHLSEEDVVFLNSQINLLNQTYIMEAHKIKKNIFFSSMSDHKIKNSSLYDHTILYLISNTIDALNAQGNQKTLIHHPFDQKRIQERIETYWNGEYYFDDQNALPYFATESQVMPFWTQSCDESSRLLGILQDFKQKQLNAGIGLAYHEKAIFYSKNSPKPRYSFFAKFCQHYQTYHTWTNLGILYLDVLYAYRHIDTIYEEFLKELKKYASKIYADGDFCELYDFETQKPYESLLYSSERKMIWGATVLDYLSDTSLQKDLLSKGL